MFIRKVGKSQDGIVKFSQSGQYATVFSEKNDSDLWEANLNVLKCFEKFLQKYGISWCKGLIFQGELVTHQGYVGWDVAGEITSIGSIVIFGSGTVLDIESIRRSISEGNLYVASTSAIKEATVVPRVVAPVEKNKRKVLPPAVSGANPVSFSRAWSHKKTRGL